MWIIIGCALLATLLIATAIKSRNYRIQNVELSQQLADSDAQLALLERDLQSAKTGRHDLKNHLTTVLGLVANADNDDAKAYLERLIAENSTKSTAISCGNAVVNSILSSKAEAMRKGNIKFILDATLPRRLNLQPTQLTGILSNLLDNAITAAKQCDAGYVDLQLRHSKGNLIIMIKNPFIGEIIKKGDSFFTTKQDSANHGLGLKSVTTTVNRLGGSCSIEHEDGVFTVFIMVEA